MPQPIAFKVYNLTLSETLQLKLEKNKLLSG